ncbi:MAG: type II secretion system GspH family protein [Phycisphaerae bacterium]|nr:type II secretion system protein [Planctomycetia bacterium]MCK6465701.1 type II secretion system GspH family protein [Phycisphaerae bacterium]MCL4718489.1 type II secretion system GspH family protein [Phycisphaerae bacterium]MCQ3921113.1 hypothetical protein [Planctomycetota bacterium]NUQ09319.1 type II secretion system protein [Phycisphaerae bacterium]
MTTTEAPQNQACRKRSRAGAGRHTPGGFTLIELLTVIAIISLLISMLLPSLSRAREQAKSVRCLASLKEFGNALAAYLNANKDRLPPALWNPDPSLLEQPVDVDFGWTETLWAYVYRNDVRVPQSFPVQRNVRGEDAWGEYFVCHTAADGVHSGHYRVYLPAWAQGSYAIQSDGRYGYDTRAEPRHGAMIEDIYQLLPMITDANEFSERGDNLGLDDCSYIDAGEADIAGSNGRNGNRISDRHYGGANYLFPDFHAETDRKLRARLARDWDLNGVEDIDGG